MLWPSVLPPTLTNSFNTVSCLFPFAPLPAHFFHIVWEWRFSPLLVFSALPQMHMWVYTCDLYILRACAALLNSTDIRKRNSILVIYIETVATQRQLYWPSAFYWGILWGLQYFYYWWEFYQSLNKSVKSRSNWQIIFHALWQDKILECDPCFTHEETALEMLSNKFPQPRGRDQGLNPEFQTLLLGLFSPKSSCFKC